LDPADVRLDPRRLYSRRNVGVTQGLVGKAEAVEGDGAVAAERSTVGVRDEALGVPGYCTGVVVSIEEDVAGGLSVNGLRFKGLGLRF
jgi:hypothetical protein